MMRKVVSNIGIFTVIGICFSLILQVLYVQGIFVDTWIAGFAASPSTNTFYFSQTASAAGPSGELSTDVDDFPANPSGKNTPLIMKPVVEATQTGVTDTYTVAVASKAMVRMFVSSPLVKQSLVGSRSGYQVKIAGKETNAAMDLYLRCFVYVWRSGVGNVKTIISPASSATETTTAERGFVITAAGSAGDFDVLAGDRIVVEVWFEIKNTLSTAYDASFYWGGSTDIVHNTANSNAASLFYSPQSLATNGTLTIDDLMVFNALLWIILGLVYSFWRS